MREKTVRQPRFKVTSRVRILHRYSGALAAVFVFMLIAGDALAQNAARDRARLDERMTDAAALIDLLMLTPESSIPPFMLARAQGIVIMQKSKSRRFAATRGTGLGIAMVRDERSGAWRTPVFLESEDGFWGFRVGGRAEDTVFLLMDERAMGLLSQEKFKIGTEVTATVGPPGTVGDVEPEASILVYVPTNELLTGTFFESGNFLPDVAGNNLYYEEPALTMEDLLFAYAGENTASGRNLIATLDKYTGNIKIVKKKRIGGLIF